MKNYHCPNFFDHQKQIFIIKDLLNQYPYAFVDNVNIGSAYGVFPNMIWNGGGWAAGITQDLGQIKDILEFYRMSEIPIRLTLTNPTLDEIDCLDKYCNSVLTIASDFSNVEILINSPILEKHIKTFYPNFILNKSILAGANNSTINEYLDDCKKYHNIVLPRRFNKDFNFLNQIPINMRNRFELLCTDPCPVNCPNLYSHYDITGDFQRGVNLDKRNLFCSHKFKTPFMLSEYQAHQISLQEIETVYEPMGFSEFKLSGRSNITGIVNMIFYFFKPEYYRDACAIILGAS